MSLKSDVLIASRHGANNGSARGFIEAINPESVIFSAGHDHEHPTAKSAARLVAHGVTANRLFRTDFGDDGRG